MRTGQRDIVTATAVPDRARSSASCRHGRSPCARARHRSRYTRCGARGRCRPGLPGIALHAVRHWTPTAAVSGSDGLWLDLTGTTHLFGGEARFAARLRSFLRRPRFHRARRDRRHARRRARARALWRLGDFGPSGRKRGERRWASCRFARSGFRPRRSRGAARFGIERVADLVPDAARAAGAAARARRSSVSIRRAAFCPSRSCPSSLRDAASPAPAA